jgi:hypothetical protein
MLFAIKYGWNGILSVFLLDPNGLFDPFGVRTINKLWLLLQLQVVLGGVA